MVRFTNTLLLFLVTFLGLSGVVMLYGAWLPWLFDLHRMAGFALLALVPWKGIIVFRSLRRGFNRSFDRSYAIVAAVVLALLVLVVVAAGWLWMARLEPGSILLQSLIAWHWILGLALIPLFLLHVWRRWHNPKMRDVFSRRDALKLAGFLAAGAAGGWLMDRYSSTLASPASPRRFTGSHGYAILEGGGFPLTGESPPLVQVEGWQLALSGAVHRNLSISYPELLAQPQQTWREILDCTNGWYTLQDWTGVRLLDLLEAAVPARPVAGVRLVSVTGYNHTYPLWEAAHILLATQVGGERLSTSHGFPLRAVVPGRRGWFWVKWLQQVEVLDDPLAVAAGMAASPRETLRQWR